MRPSSWSRASAPVDRGEADPRPQVARPQVDLLGARVAAVPVPRNDVEDGAVVGRELAS